MVWAAEIEYAEVELWYDCLFTLGGRGVFISEEKIKTLKFLCPSALNGERGHSYPKLLSTQWLCSYQGKVIKSDE